ncbi:uncharacterized protein LOC128955477 [Oppia nitens]|uniref:uncharacterized protein LOC128955477 n=1 Tax=Oppia nitens TaxID=1686743 RepID=UPI0023DCEA5E|nr:uncharacterized protein LOC128955477 [Oppia nitens]
MLKITAALVLLMCAAVLADDCYGIIEDQSDKGKALIKRIVDLVNEVEKKDGQTMTYIRIIDCMGEKGHYIAYLQYYNQDNVKYSCTTDVDLVGTDSYNLSNVKCHPSN